jgi:hypothetical protein
LRPADRLLAPGAIEADEHEARGGAASHEQTIVVTFPAAALLVPDITDRGADQARGFVARQPAVAASVFDSRTASVHVDDVNDVAYTPFPLRILGQLAKLCQDLREKLNAEIKQIENQTPHAVPLRRLIDGRR